LKHLLEIIINIEMKFFVRIVLILIGSGKKNLKERKKKKQDFVTFDMSRFFRYLQAFQKVRDCSYIHEHAGTSAKIQVIVSHIFNEIIKSFLFSS
jgi:hypothetical protein